MNTVTMNMNMSLSNTGFTSQGYVLPIRVAESQEYVYIY